MDRNVDDRPANVTDVSDATHHGLERAKAAAEAANEAKSRYLVAVSHEIRSPLNAIYGYAQLLERGDAVSSTEAGAVIRRSAEHLTSLVEGLLEISQIDRGVLKVRSDVIDIRALLDQIIEMFRIQAFAKGLDIDLHVSDRLPRLVKTDEKRLRQILINLVSNAIKYTRQGGVTVTVDFRSQVADLKVLDTGIGIAPDEIERVFEPFERGSSPETQFQPGIGLGLAITRVLARVMGGDIAATSTPGLGSCFRLRLMLPTPSRSIDSVALNQRIAGYRGARRTLLVIDDDPAQSAVLQSLLRPLGFVVYAAGAGPEGIVLAAHCAPDIILLDIQMPGMSGWETASRLRAARGGAVKIVMVSANADELRAREGGETIHDGFVTKPVDFDALLAVIGKQLQLHWDHADPVHGSGESEAVARLPIEAQPFLEQLRHFAEIGHVLGIESQLAEFRQAVPAAGAFVESLQKLLNEFDLRTLLKKLDDAEQR